MEPEEYDSLTGYALKDLKSKYLQREYELQPHEEDTIEGVKEQLESGFYDDRSVVIEHSRILKALLEKLQTIYSAEEKAGLVNWQLRAKIAELRQISVRLTRQLGIVPKFKVFRSM